MCKKSRILTSACNLPIGVHPVQHLGGVSVFLLEKVDEKHHFWQIVRTKQYFPPKKTWKMCHFSLPWEGLIFTLLVDLCQTHIPLHTYEPSLDLVLSILQDPFQTILQNNVIFIHLTKSHWSELQKAGICHCRHDVSFTGICKPNRICRVVPKEYYLQYCETIFFLYSHDFLKENLFC